MTTYQTWGLVIQLVFLAIGLYLYLFSRGLIRFGSEELRERSEYFRRDNAGWMRVLGLALAAVMLANIVIGLMEVSAQNN